MQSPLLRLIVISLSCATILTCGAIRSLTLAEEPAQVIAPEILPNNVVEKLAERIRPSVVVVTTSKADGSRMGLGTGFVVSADGLIATNYHVIGDARPISVQLSDGKRHEVTQIVATDRLADLALIRIPANNLMPLELGDADEVKPGRPVVALGNPLGLKYSVVAGIVSATREIDGRPMIQLAIPVEPGNSGGPIVDLEGRVVGVLSTKSAVTANLGFAVTINQLRPLLEHPNPIPLSRWLAIGSLDAAEWKIVNGARWRRRGGHIVVDGAGDGFGGRALCLSQKSVPELPFEIAVTVKLDDEAGAAGLVFYADGMDRHYGFYPSAGQLRLTRFNGPDVSSWAILFQQPSPHYHAGEWNTLKVRQEADRTLCYVNDQLVVETKDRVLEGRLVGLAKFRDTRAEFKHFQIAPQISTSTVSEEQRRELAGLLESLLPGTATTKELLERLAPQSAFHVSAIREEARRLADRSTQLQALAKQVHRHSVLNDLASAVGGSDEQINLLRGALLIARLDNEEIDVSAYENEVEAMGREIRAKLPEEASEADRLAAIDRYLFEEHGFHGCRSEYYVRANSYINEVIDQREGLPITLSLLYMELAKRLGLSVVGIGLPGHFVVEYRPSSGEPRLIDVFEGAESLSRETAKQRVAAATGSEALDQFFQPITHRALLVRILRNLLGISQRQQDPVATLGDLDALLTVDPRDPEPRLMRGMMRFQSGDRDGALADLDRLLEDRPAGLNVDRVTELRAYIESQR